MADNCNDGLNLPNMLTKSKALKVSYVKRLLQLNNNEKAHSGDLVCDRSIPPEGKENIFYCNLNENDIKILMHQLKLITI